MVGSQTRAPGPGKRGGHGCRVASLPSRSLTWTTVPSTRELLHEQLGREPQRTRARK